MGGGKRKIAARTCSNPCVFQLHALDFLDLGGFALTAAQIIQLGPANLTAANQVHMIYTRRMNRERTFHTDSIRHPAYSERFPDAAVALGDNSTFESLQTLTVAFNNLYPHTNGIADIELRKVGTDLLCFDRTNNLIHWMYLLPL